MSDQQPLGIETIVREVNVASGGVAKASTELARLIKAFENVVDEGSGEVSLGIGARYEIAIDTERVAIYEDAIENEKRPPAEDIRDALARKRVRAKHPQLDAEYRRVTTEMKALQGWISSQKQVISGKQSVLNGLRGLGA